MEKPKNNLMKSKSLNGTSAVKTRSDKKSRSNAEIKPIALKKRSMYVEKKPTTILLNETAGNLQNKLKCTTRSRKRQFTNTVLHNNIVETQYSYSNYPSSSHCAKNINKINKKHNEYSKHFISSKRKQKCRPRALDNFQNEMEDFNEPKEGISCPSNDSLCDDPEKIKWSTFLPRLVPKTDSELEYEMKIKMIELARHLESNTLIDDESNKIDTNLYSFFINLLENTLAKNDVVTERDKIQSTGIDMIENKMETGKTFDDRDDKAKVENKEAAGVTNKYCTKSNKINEEVLDEVSCARSVTPINMFNRKRKVKSKSFANKMKSPEMTTHSLIYQKPMMSTKRILKDRKQDLLNSLKEQLRIDQQKYMGPKNIYQALKLMAKSKRCNQKSIHFEESKNEVEQDAPSVIRSILKRYHLLSQSTRPKKTSNMTKYFHTYSQNSTIPSTRKTCSDIVEINNESSHSLQVYAFDFESPKENKFDVSFPDNISRNELGSEINLYLSDECSDFEGNCYTLSGNHMEHHK